MVHRKPGKLCDFECVHYVHMWSLYMCVYVWLWILCAAQTKASLSERKRSESQEEEHDGALVAELQGRLHQDKRCIWRKLNVMMGFLVALLVAHSMASWYCDLKPGLWPFLQVNPQQKHNSNPDF